MQIKAIHHVHLRTPDLDGTERFATDFGLIAAERTAERLVLRTGGGDAFAYIAEAGEKGFVGLAMEVASEDDLAEAIEQHGASAVRELDTPGGGRAVSLTDPNGFQIDLVHGIVRRDPDTSSSPDLQHNTPGNRVRLDVNQHRRPLGPPMLYRLGHAGLFVKNFGESAEWYGRVLGAIGSDVYHVPGVPHARIVGFFRLDHHETYVEHHTIALMQREQPDCHHVSFEAQDFEAQFVAHRFLKGRGYESIWGVGRHPHGSHVFDVWRDPNGYRFETFSDTDYLKASHGTRYHDISQVQMDEWSSDPPDRYFA